MQIKTTKVESIDDIEFELIQSGKMKESNSYGYVNNKEFYAELCKYHKRKMECIEQDLPIPPLTNKIGAAIIQIATRRCNSHMYRGYSNNWKEEMISNAIMTATIHGHNFDPERSENPFAYFTQICDNAIKQQLKNEKLELYTRYKSIDEARGFLAEEDEQHNDQDFLEPDSIDVTHEARSSYIDQFEQRVKERKLLAKQKKEDERDPGVLILLQENGLQSDQDLI